MQAARFYWLSNNEDRTPPHIGSMDVISPIDFNGVWISLKKNWISAVCRKKNLTLHLHMTNYVLKTLIKRTVLYSKPHFGGKKKILLPWQLAQSLVRQTWPVLPPLHSWPGALAAATCLAGAFWAGEKLCHELGHVRELRVGAQHVHGLFNLLQRHQRNRPWAHKPVWRFV